MVLFTLLMKVQFMYKQTMELEGDASDARRVQPRFLYAIQAENCLPIHLKKALGNPDECDCDVLVLNYKQSCTAVSQHRVLYQWLYPELARRTKPACCGKLPRVGTYSISTTVSWKMTLFLS